MKHLLDNQYNQYQYFIIVLLIGMIGKKSGKNCLKKFVLIQTKAQFDLLGCNQNYSLAQKNQKIEQEIIVPSFCKIEPACSIKNKSVPLNYVKTYNVKKLMNSSNYQLDELDLNFLKQINLGIDSAALSDIIRSLQKRAFRQGFQFNYYKIISKVIKNHNLNFQKPKADQVFRLIFNYWRNKRRNLRSPLLRMYWSKNETGPYKLREQTSLCLRNRTIKVEPNAARQILKQDLLALKNILLLMRSRQIEERKLIFIQTRAFQKLSKQVLKKVSKSNRKLISSQQNLVNKLSLKKPDNSKPKIKNSRNLVRTKKKIYNDQ